jgi:hypothetical protein
MNDIGGLKHNIPLQFSQWIPTTLTKEAKPISTKTLELETGMMPMLLVKIWEVIYLLFCSLESTVF